MQCEVGGLMGRDWDVETPMNNPADGGVGCCC